MAQSKALATTQDKVPPAPQVDAATPTPEARRGPETATPQRMSPVLPPSNGEPAEQRGAAGTNLTYSLTVTNNGPSDSTGGTVSDVLPAGLTFVSSATGCTESLGTVTCPVGALAALGNQVLSFVAAVDVAVTAPISNTATVAANETDLVPANDTANQMTTVSVETDLSITKSDAPDPVVAGTNLTYTLTVNTAGRVDARGGVDLGGDGEQLGSAAGGGRGAARGAAARRGCWSRRRAASR